VGAANRNIAVFRSRTAPIEAMSRPWHRQRPRAKPVCGERAATPGAGCDPCDRELSGQGHLDVAVRCARRTPRSADIASRSLSTASVETARTSLWMNRCRPWAAWLAPTLRKKSPGPSALSTEPVDKHGDKSVHRRGSASNGAACARFAQFLIAAAARGAARACGWSASPSIHSGCGNYPEQACGWIAAGLAPVGFRPVCARNRQRAARCPQGLWTSVVTSLCTGAAARATVRALPGLRKSCSVSPDRVFIYI